MTAARASVITRPEGSGQVIGLTSAAAWRNRGRRMASGCTADTGSTGRRSWSTRAHPAGHLLLEMMAGSGCRQAARSPVGMPDPWTFASLAPPGVRSWRGLWPLEGTWTGMSLSRRIAMLFRAKANKALDRAEDPREMLDYSYERQLELLQQVRRGLADVATSRRRVELQLAQLQQSAAKLQGQAQQALAAGREDLAREALTRRAAVASQIGDLEGQKASLQAEQDKLTVAAQRLQAKVQAFRTRKETIKAAYTAAEAETRVREAVTGISEEMGDVGLAVQRAQDKTEQLQARAGALDELLASGALEDATVPGGRDDLQSQLDALTAGHDVDDELARMKAQLPARLPRRPSRPPNGVSRSAAAGMAGHIVAWRVASAAATPLRNSGAVRSCST